MTLDCSDNVSCFDYQNICELNHIEPYLEYQETSEKILPVLSAHSCCPELILCEIVSKLVLSCCADAIEIQRSGESTFEEMLDRLNKHLLPIASRLSFVRITVKRIIKTPEGSPVDSANQYAANKLPQFCRDNFPESTWEVMMSPLYEDVYYLKEEC